MVERRTAPLTPEEEEALIVYREATMKRGLATGPVNRPEAEVIIRDVYIAAELAEPKMYFWADSPMAGVYLSGVLVSFFGNTDIDKLLTQFRDKFPNAGEISNQEIAIALNRSAMKFVEKFQS